VKHVTVNADQAVVADTVVGGSKGPVEISNEGNNSWMEPKQSQCYRRASL